MPEYSGQVTHVELALVPLWLIVALPFLGATINALFGRTLQASTWQEGLKKRLHIGSPAVSAVALGAVGLAFVLTIVNFVQLLGLEAGHRHLFTHAWSMVAIGSFKVSFSFAMDPLGAVMALIVTG
ncbi:MAG: NADH-quinone oxidoreductase subunit L, partial [Deltaproteobacteria bacterium]|nr:NADH-quinone oxidoreductase subunit L [Deltaproteobacteria bacterium]